MGGAPLTWKLPTEAAVCADLHPGQASIRPSQPTGLSGPLDSQDEEVNLWRKAISPLL